MVPTEQFAQFSEMASQKVSHLSRIASYLHS